MQKEWQNHLKDEEFLGCLKWDANPKELEKWMEHIANCTYCADRFTNFIPLEIEPPQYLQEEILESVGHLHVQIEKSMKSTSKKVQMFLYSLKVAFAISASIVMLFVCAGSFHEINLQEQYHDRYESHNTYVRDNRRNENQITTVLNRFADDYLSPF